MMKPTLKQVAGGAALFLAGCIGGSVLADTAALSFKDATLFQAAQRIHQNAGPDVVWTGVSTEPRTFNVPAADSRSMLGSAAEQFGRTLINVSGVTVLDTALPTASTGKERLSTLGAWLEKDLPTQLSGFKDHDIFAPFSKAMKANVSGLQSQLPPGTVMFTSLTPDQQQSALDALRQKQIFGLLSPLHLLAR